MHITEHVEPCRHRGLKANAASRRHSCGGDGRRLWPVINSGDQSRLEKFSAGPGDGFPHDQKPDHFSEACRSDELLNRVATDVNAAGFHIYDLRPPPVGHVIAVTHVTPSVFIVSMSAGS